MKPCRNCRKDDHGNCLNPRAVKYNINNKEITDITCCCGYPII